MSGRRSALLDAPSPIPEVNPAASDAAISRDLSYEAVLAKVGVYRNGGVLVHKWPEKIAPTYWRDGNGRLKRTVHKVERPVAMDLEVARTKRMDYYHPGGPLREGGRDVGSGWILWGVKRTDDYPENTGNPLKPYIDDVEDVDESEVPPDAVIAAGPPAVLEEDTPDV